MRKILIIVSFILILCGCNSTKFDIQKLMSENEYTIIDVRTKEEYEEQHIVESINIPYDEIGKEINIDKEQILFVYCQSGNRSKIAFNKLTNLGYTVYDLGAISNIDLPKE